MNTSITENFTHFFLAISFLSLSLLSCKGNSDKIKNEEATIRLLKDSLTALQSAWENLGEKESENFRQPKFVYSAIETTSAKYTYIPRRVTPGATPITIDGAGQIHSGRTTDDIVIEGHWGNKELISHVYFSDVTELKDYSEESKFKFLDKNEKIVRNLNSGVVLDNGIYDSPRPKKEFNIIKREIFEFDTYSEASVSLFNAKKRLNTNE